MVRRERQRRVRMHQQGQDAQTDHLRQQAHGQEREVLAQPAGVLGAAEGPQPVELEVPQVGHEERDGGEHVVPADVVVGQRQAQEDVVLIRPDLVGDHGDQQVHEHAGETDNAEPEQEQPVVPMPDEQEMSQPFHRP